MKSGMQRLVCVCLHCMGQLKLPETSLHVFIHYIQQLELLLNTLSVTVLSSVLISGASSIFGTQDCFIRGLR